MNKQKLINIAEKYGFYVKIEKQENNNYYVLFEQSTPLGEDWCLEYEDKTLSKIVEQIVEYADDYDADEEAAGWIECRGQRGVPSSVRDLLEDADWKGETLKNFAEALNN